MPFKGKQGALYLACLKAQLYLLTIDTMPLIYNLIDTIVSVGYKTYNGQNQLIAVSYTASITNTRRNVMAD